MTFVANTYEVIKQTVVLLWKKSRKYGSLSYLFICTILVLIQNLYFKFRAKKRDRKKTAQPKLHSRHEFLSSAWLTWHYLAVICCNSTPLHSTDATLHSAQLPGWLFSPSDVWKKQSQAILLHFLFGMGLSCIISSVGMNFLHSFMSGLPQLAC